MKFLKSSWVTISQIILFLFMFFWEYVTPLWADDLQSSHLSLKGIMDLSRHEWFSWNGRFFGQSFFRIMILSNQVVGALLNSLIFVLLITLMAKLSIGGKKTKISFLRFWLVTIATIIFIPTFGQTVLWRAGAGNYLWMTTFNLGFLYIYLKTNFFEKPMTWLKLVSFLPFLILSLIAGWSNENTAGGTLIIILVYTIIKLYKKDRVNFVYWLGLIVFSIGYAFLLLAPGNANRTLQTLGPDYLQKPLLVRISHSLFDVNKAMLSSDINKILIVSIIVMLVLLVNYWKDKVLVFQGLTWTMAGLAVIYALSLSPMGQNGGRAFFGGIIYLVIGLFSMLPSKVSVYDSNSLAKSITEIAMILLIAFGFLIISNGIIDSYRSSVSIKERYTFIRKEAHREDYKSIIKVPPLRYLPQTPYSVDYPLKDLVGDVNGYPNFLYKIYLGVKGVLPQ